MSFGTTLLFFMYMVRCENLQDKLCNFYGGQMNKETICRVINFHVRRAALDCPNGARAKKAS